MNRRARSPEPFGRNVRQRTDDTPPVRLLWRFQSDHITGGPAHDVPISIRATPIEFPGVSTEEYIAQLAPAFQVIMISLVRGYARRFGHRRLSTDDIRRLPIFFFPTDVPLFLTLDCWWRAASNRPWGSQPW